MGNHTTKHVRADECIFCKAKSYINEAVLLAPISRELFSFQFLAISIGHLLFFSLAISTSIFDAVD